MESSILDTKFYSVIGIFKTSGRRKLGPSANRYIWKMTFKLVCLCRSYEDWYHVCEHYYWAHSMWP